MLSEQSWFVAPRAHSADLALDDALARMQACPDVEGVLALGSTRDDQLTPDSDLDLVLVLNRYPAPLYVGLTTLAGRVTDLLFLQTSAVEAIRETTGPLCPDDWAVPGLVWLLEGQILFDRHGLLRETQAVLHARPTLPPHAPGTLYGKWFHLNFNLAHNRRLQASNDPLYRLALEYRLLFCLADLLVQYVELRGQRWGGEKAAFRYLQGHDPAYLDLYQRALTTTDRDERFALYVELCAQTCAPVGPLWPAVATAFVFDDGAHTDATRLHSALAWWESLLEG